MLAQELPERHLVEIVHATRARILHLVDGRSGRNLVEGHGVDVVGVDTDVLDAWESLEAVLGLIFFRTAPNLVLEFCNSLAGIFVDTSLIRRCYH